MADGWIKLHWKLKRSLAGSSAVSTGVWVHLLLRAARRRVLLNNGHTLEPGEVIISEIGFGRDLNITRKVMRRILSEFERDGMIEVVKRDRNGTRLSICNWRTYQDSPDAEGQQRTTNEQQTSNKRTLNEHQTEIPKIPKSPKNNSGRKPSAPTWTEADREIAGWMFDRIRDLQPSRRKPDLDAWANHVRLMRERDGRTHEQIRGLFVWANEDSFWQANILSPAKLREKWDDLELKRNRVPPPQQSKTMLAGATWLAGQSERETQEQRLLTHDGDA